MDDNMSERKMLNTHWFALDQVLYRVCGLCYHGGYCHEIRHRAWQIKTGSWWCKMHWLLWQKRGSPGPL